MIVTLLAFAGLLATTPAIAPKRYRQFEVHGTSLVPTMLASSRCACRRG